MQTDHTKLSTRAHIILALVRVQQGESLNTFFDGWFERIVAQDKGFAHELLYGTLRQWFALLRISQRFAKDEVVEPHALAAIHIGLYQLLYLSTPDHAAIGETVQALKEAGQPSSVKKLTGLVNAILRRAQKKQLALSKQVVKNHSLPNWLAKQLKVDWQVQYDALGQALRALVPIYLRINPRKIAREAYSALLTEAGIAHELVEGTAEQVILLTQQVRISELPHYADGFFAVQDLHAQHTGYLFSDLNEKVVLDACAAPGGKTTQLLELFTPKTLVALDNDEVRLMRVQQNIERLGLANTPTEIQLITADATSYAPSHTEASFDAILLDAPCTATGVICRHPDISLLRQQSDVADTCKLQAAMLDNLWQYLKVGGELIYATCSLLKAENDAQIGAFLARTPNAQAQDITTIMPASAVNSDVGCQLFPFDGGGDGFYFAKLVKISA